MNLAVLCGDFQTIFFRLVCCSLERKKIVTVVHNLYKTSHLVVDIQCEVEPMVAAITGHQCPDAHNCN